MTNSIRMRKRIRFLTKMGQKPSFIEKEDFNDLYLQTHLSVFRYTLSLLGGPQQDAEDITAKTYFLAWQSRHSFIGDENAAIKWLLKIARNLVIDVNRHLKVRGKHEPPELSNIENLDRTVETRVIFNEQKTILWGMVQDLTEVDREIITLRYFLGFRINEIAAYLEIPENTVSVKLRRILSRLRSVLNEALNE